MHLMTAAHKLVGTRPLALAATDCYQLTNAYSTEDDVVTEN